MKKAIQVFTLVVFFSLTGLYANAQYFKPGWVNDIGGTGDSKATNIVADNSGNIYISGYIRGTVTFNLKEGGSKTLTSNGDADIYIAKYVIATGNYEWAISMGGPGLEQPNSMTLDNLGNVLIIGQFQSTVNFNPAGSFPLTANGADDIFIAKYTSAGSFVWATSMGGSDIDRGHYIVTDNQNNVFITASYTGAVDVDPSAVGVYTLPDQGSLAGFFAKYDANGNFVWAHPLGNLNQQNLVNITIDKTTNDVVIDGDFYGNVDFSYAGNAAATFNSPSTSNFLARYTNNGAYEWVKYLPGSGSGILSSLKIDNLSNIVITGNFGGQFYPSGPAGSAITANGASDILVASYTSAGGLNWAENFGSGTGNASSRYVTLDASNNIYVTGYFTGVVNIDPTLSNGVLTNNTGGRSVLIAGFNSSGKPIAAGAFGSSCTSNLGYETTAIGGFIYVAGSFCQTVNFDTGSCQTDNFTSINATSDSFLAQFSIVSPGPIINNTITAPAITTFCGNTDPAVIAASTPTGGSGIYTYQWQSSPDNVTFTDIAGATAITYDPPVINATTYYHRVVSSACALPSTSNAIELIIEPALANNALTAPAIISFCANGDPGVITGSTPTGGGGTYTYQWQSSPDNTTFTDIAGATAISYDPPVINATTYYRRTVTSGACTTPFVSNAVAINIQPALANNTLKPQPVTTFCGQYNPLTNGVADLTASTPTGGDGTYSYQWQSSPDNVTFTNITGATSSDLLLSTITVTTYFRRMVTSGACATPLASNAIAIIIQPVLANNNLASPAVTSFCGNGDPAVITGTTPTGGSGIYTYQWQSSPDNVTFSNIPGATSANYDPPVINATTYYQRIVTSGSCNTPFVSKVVSIIVNAIPPAPLSSTTTPNICAGSTVTITIGSPQPGLTYDWYDSPTKTNHLFTGVSYTTPPLFANTTFYVGATNGTCTSASLGTVTVNVSAIPAQPTVTSGQVTVCNGSSASLSISNPQAGITYNWYAAATGGTTVFTGADFITPAVTSGITYYAEAANAGGCVSAARTPVNIAVNPLPQVTGQGASVCPGTSATLTASSTDANATINWYTSASGGSAIFTGTTFTTQVLNANTTYYAEAADNTSGCVSATRSLAQVQILQPLPAPVVSVSATTTSSITFSWSAVNGATGYQVSTDNGQTFTDPSSGNNGLTHTVSGLQAQQTVTIIVRATGSSACEQSANSAIVTGIAASPLGDQIFVPNAFTPNSDGKNDIVYVRGPNIKSLKFYIYDQWGELIYTSLNQANGWDGTYKGSKEPVGVYVYYVEAIMNDGKQVSKKGSVTLLR